MSVPSVEIQQIGRKAEVNGWKEQTLEKFFRKGRERTKV